MTSQRRFRALGGVDQGTLPPSGEVAEALREEFGRHTTAQDEAKLRTLVASVQGASRLAIRLGLLTPEQVRALWAEAMAKGLYEGWDGGQSAYGHPGEGV